MLPNFENLEITVQSMRGFRGNGSYADIGIRPIMPRLGLCRAGYHNRLPCGKVGAACRHNLERFEERQKFVTRSISFGLLINWLCQSHGLFL